MGEVQVLANSEAVYSKDQGTNEQIQTDCRQANEEPCFSLRHVTAAVYINYIHFSKLAKLNLSPTGPKTSPVISFTQSASICF